MKDSRRSVLTEGSQSTSPHTAALPGALFEKQAAETESVVAQGREPRRKEDCTGAAWGVWRLAVVVTGHHAFAPT